MMSTDGVIGIVDLGIGNLRSVANAVDELGYDVEILNRPAQWDAVSHLILPGVGHFGTAMATVSGERWLEPLRNFAFSGRPLLGICLGMQLLAETGTEGGISSGLGLIPGTVVRLEASDGFPVPHVGWNVLRTLTDHPVFEGLKADRDFYFVHSYQVVCNDQAHCVAVTEYPEPVTAVIARGNIVGFQFHPEKSQVNGLQLLENFCNWDGRC